MINSFRKQYKGKDIGKINLNNIPDDNYFYGIKFDGNYVQIHKNGDNVIFYTSSGLPFVVESIKKELLEIDSDFIIEAEFNGKGSTGEKLGDRRRSSTTGHVANYRKGLISDDFNSCIHIFDILKLGDVDLTTEEYYFRLRYSKLKDLFKDIQGHSRRVSVVDFLNGNLNDARRFSVDLVSKGYEGAFCYHYSHIIKDVGRSNLAIKIKKQNHGRGICIGAVPSKTVPEEIGSLTLEFMHFNKRIIANFGGISDKLRKSDINNLIGREFEFRYEDIVKGRVIQGFIA